MDCFERDAIPGDTPYKRVNANLGRPAHSAVMYLGVLRNAGGSFCFLFLVLLLISSAFPFLHNIPLR